MYFIFWVNISGRKLLATEPKQTQEELYARAVVSHSRTNKRFHVGNMGGLPSSCD